MGGLGLTVGLRALRGPRGTVGVITDNYGRLGDLQVGRREAVAWQ